MTTGGRVAIGVLAATVVAVVAYRARSLTRAGAAAAAVIGTVAVAAGWDWAVVLIVYFGSSSLLSRVGVRRKTARLAGMVDKTGARDATQVAANGLGFLICAILAIISPSADAFLWSTAGAASLAASAADTWATEVGTLVGQVPRSILTLRRMTIGESGGVTFAGWLGVFAGASLIGLVGAVVMGLGRTGFALTMLGGVVGASVDSVVGFSLQRRSWCDACARGTEMRLHICGTRTRHVGGIAWLENDGVNLIATIVGGLVPWAVTVIFLNRSPV